jgi:RNA polymerase sigma factor (sigma-70 family)
MTTETAPSPSENDIALVAQSLAGSRTAFGRIVERYQSLVCALAFSATGSVSRSEDLAQETFVTAWRQLRALREPAKFRSWLCGIARNRINNDLRRQIREPVHAAAPLAEAEEVASPEPALLAQVINNEEVALLWREVGQLPEIYREPLVLFYREHRSVARVAEALELSEDTVNQRLSRGRRQLHERMLAFVEHGLERTSPNAQFTAAVQAALPILAVGGQAGAAVAMTKGATFKGGGILGTLGSWLLLPVVGMFAAAGLSWSSIHYATNEGERRFAKRWNTALWLSIAGLMAGFTVLDHLADSQHWSVGTSVAFGTALWSGYLMILGGLLVVSFQKACWLCLRDAIAPRSSPPVSAHVKTLSVLGAYVAVSAWVIWLTWIIGDRWTSAGLTGIMAVMAGWNLRVVQGRTRADYQRITAIFNGIASGVIILAVNLRVDHWLAPIYNVPLAEMYRLLPMAVVHLLTVLLVAWIVGLLVLTKPDASRIRPAVG